MRVDWFRVAYLSVLLCLLELSAFLFSLRACRVQEELAQARARLYAEAWIKLASRLGNTRALLRFTDYYLSLGGELRGDVLRELQEGLRQDAYLKDVMYLAMGLKALDDDDALRYLRLASISEDYDVRRVANTYKLFIMSSAGGEVIKEIVKGWLKGKVDDRYLEEVVRLILEGAKLIGNLFLKDQMLKLLDSPNPVLRTSALYILAVLFKHAKADDYVKMLGDPVGSVRLTALCSLLYLQRQGLLRLERRSSSFELLLRSDEEESVRLMALALLGSVRSQLVYDVARGELVPDPMWRDRSPIWRDRSESLLVVRWRAYAIALLEP